MQQDRRRNRAIRAGIVGTGTMAATHARAMRNLAGVELVACARPNVRKVETFAADHGIASTHPDVRAMVETARLDLVSVCTPPASHLELSIDALEAGAWVLCEKPLCSSLAELDAVEAVEKATGRYCSSVLQWRFGSGARHLKQLVDAGTLGRPLLAVCQTTWFRDDAYYRVPWRGTWKSELGGATVGQGIHAMDLLLWLLGDWRELHATMGTVARDIEIEDVSMAMVRFENGAMASVVNSVVSPRESTVLRIDFEWATAELICVYTTDDQHAHSDDDWRITWRGPRSGHPADIGRPPGPEVPPSHEEQLRATITAMRDGIRPPVSGIEARRALEFATHMYKSAATNVLTTRAALDPDDRFYRDGFGAAARALDSLQKGA